MITTNPRSITRYRCTQPQVQGVMFRFAVDGFASDLASGVSLTEKKKSVPAPVFPKKPAGTPCAQPWLVAVGGWRLAAVGYWQLATGGWWRLVVVRRLVAGGWWLEAVGSGWQLVVGRRRRLAAVGGWRLVAVGGWRLVAVGS